ncbi:MAG: PhzF family phenazine biosynthesis protein [Desulfocapsaceae bacterium]
MKLNIYQVDAFAEKVFEGNPAAVCPLEEWVSDDILQKIAEENNLSETAFFAPEDQGFKLRWFTPGAEVDLCGHATLAAAYVLYKHLGYSGPEISFSTRSGNLVVRKGAKGLDMDFPASMPEVIQSPDKLVAGLGIEPKEVLAAFDYIAVFDNEDQIENLNPDFSKWLDLELRGVVVTAPGNDVDFVSRCFFPKLRVNEDPVTGSAHCELAPFWGARLGLKNLRAKQLSKRTGLVECALVEDRVVLSGNAVSYMQGQIII